MSLIAGGTEIKEIGERIREARREVNLTQDELGEALGLTGGAISKIENGYSDITLKSLLKLPEILGQPISYFLGSDLSLRNLTPDESELLGLYRALPEGFPRQSARGILRTLLETVRRNRGLGDGDNSLSTERTGSE